MLSDIDKFYLDKEEPVKSCLMALRTIILRYHPELTPQWRYRLPCFMYRNQIFCYLWVDRKTQFPYVAIGKGVQIDHPELIQGSRTFVKLFMVDPNQDIPVDTLYSIFDRAMTLHSAPHNKTQAE